MIKIKEVINIINNLPNILQYFVPGFWTIFVFGCITAKKSKGTTCYIMSCVISYLLITFVTIIQSTNKFKMYFDKISKNNLILMKSFLAIMIGTIFAVIVGIVISQKWYSNLTVKLFHKTPNQDIWRDGRKRGKFMACNFCIREI